MNNAFSPAHLIGLFPILLPLLMAVAGWLTLRLVRWSARAPRRPSLFGLQGYFLGHHPEYITHWSRGLLEKLGNLDQVYETIGPEKIVAHQLSRLRPQLDGFIDDVMNTHHQVVWENMPILVKNRFYARAHRLLPRMIDDIVEELGDNLRRILSYPQLLQFAEQDTPGTLQRIYDLLSLRAFQQLAWFSFYCGLVAGCVQLAIAAPLHLLHSEAYWILTGAGIGACFFWFCQSWVQPPQPTPRKGFTWRNLVQRLREQQERELADLLAETVLSPRNLARTLILGTKARHVHTIIRKRMAPLVEDLNVRTLAQLTVGPIGYVNLKQSLNEQLTASFMEPFEDEDFNQARGKALAEFLHVRIAKQPDQLFYQQMKWVLDPLAILGTCGGCIVGALMGSLQWLLLSL
ncbi:MAG TPA: hypothetical protein VM553_13115 [Dongiaceae bacterium]|nr:hypothetical protein [Dongiaceae bacterium]